MNFDDIKDGISTKAGQTWDRLQESSTYNQIKDRFEGLTPVAQKVVLASIGLLIAIFVLVTPWSNISTSSDSIGQFENKRDLIRNLLKVSRETSSLPTLPMPPQASSLRGEIENKLNEAILAEQIRSIDVVSSDGALIPQKLVAGGINISLIKLNLRQVVDVGYRLQSLHPSVKMKDMFVTANRQDSRYFDVIYKLISLNVPDMTAPPAPVEDEPKKGAKVKKKTKAGDDQ